MSYKMGENIVHQKFGMGVIVSIEEMSFSGNEPRLFYHVDFSRATVWIPVEDQPNAKLRRVISKDRLPHYREVLGSTPMDLDKDFRKRQYSLKDRAKRGTFQDYCEIIRDLEALSSTKPLNTSDNRLYTQVWDALVREWATVSGQSSSETEVEMTSCLPQKGDVNYG